MSSKENARQEEPRSARPPEYTIIHRQATTHSRARQQPPLKQTGQSRKEARFAEKEARREQRQEQLYRSKRKRQWIVAMGIMIVFIGLLALALYFISSRSASATPAGNEVPAGSAPYHASAGF